MSAEFDSLPMLEEWGPPIPESEEWRPVPGSEGYEVSDYGRVRKGSRLLTNSVNTHGYVSVHVDGKAVCVHRLVLTAFVGPRPDGMECRHLDGDQLNNDLPNLRWGTREENWQDRKRHARERQERR